MTDCGGGPSAAITSDSTYPYSITWDTSACGFLITGSATGPNVLPHLLYANSIDISSETATPGSPDSIWIIVTLKDVTDPSGVVDFLSSFTVNSNPADTVPAGWGVELATYVDTANTGALATLLGVECWGTPGCASFSSGAVNVGGTYSATAVFKITATSVDQVNLTIDLEATQVPLPAALPLLLSGLAGLGFMGWRRRANPGNRSVA